MSDELLLIAHPHTISRVNGIQALMARSLLSTKPSEIGPDSAAQWFGDSLLNRTGYLQMEASNMTLDPNRKDPQRNELLAQIREGMKVVDSGGDDVGKVNYVQMADVNDPDDNPGSRDGGISLLDPANGDNEGGGLLDAFTGGTDVTERMRRLGYVKIDASGLFSGDKYVEPDQISAVEGDTVRLSVSKDDIDQPS